jgi:predicted ATPase
MLKCLAIKNFKSFESQFLDLGNLTVLTGLNNTGKSTAIQALRMCLSEHNAGGPYISGLGGYAELRSRQASISDEIEVGVLLDKDQEITLSISKNSFSHHGKDRAPLTQFISADRFGPRVGLPTLGDDIASLAIGNNGEYSAHFAALMEGCIIPEPLRHPDAQGNTLKAQLNWWMNDIAPGIKLDYGVQEKLDMSHLSVDGFRPTNSGYGISYALPIVLALLTMPATMVDDSDPRVVRWFQRIKDSGSCLILENPEAHLHPRGQTGLGILAAMAAFTGVQVIIETHSDHVLDGVRLAVKTNKNISADKINIYFFTKNLSESTVADKVTLRPDGKLDRWPDGFFDQHSKNLRALASGRT